LDLVQCSKGLLYRSPYYGHLALGIQKAFSDHIPTACCQINGMMIDMWFNEEYFNKLTDKQKIGLMEHEVGHICLFHLIYWDNYAEKEIYNIAADMVINQYIETDYLPPNAMLPTSFPELNLPPFKDTKFYYDELCKANQNNKSPKLKGLVNFMKQGGKTVCGHPLWDSAEDGEPIPDGMKELIKAQIEHQMKEVYEHTFNKQPGSVPGHLRDFILNLYIKTPPVLDWRQVMRQFKSFCDKQVIKFTQNKPNKRYPDQAAITLNQRRKMLVGVDVSGSISPSQLSEFFNQISYMNKSGVEIEIVTWDFGIQDKFDFSNKKKWQNSQVKGGGGTDPTEVIQLLNKGNKYNALIMFTDGYVSGKYLMRSRPILWVVTAGGDPKLVNFPGKKILAEGLK